MESTLQNPFGFFDYYLTNGIYKSLISFYDEGIKHLGEIHRIDKNQHTIEVKESDGLITYSFAEQVSRKLNSEVKKSRKMLEYQFQKTYLNNQEQRYGDFLRVKYDDLMQLKSVAEFPFIRPLLETLLITINQFSKTQNVSIPGSSLSFAFLAETEDVQKQKVNKLYDLLISGAFIQSSRVDFINAFTGKPIGQKVRWLVKTRIHTNKASLFYLIETLIDNTLLPRRTNKNLFSRIRYVFAGFDGMELKNLNISHNQMSSTPNRKEDIDAIVEEIRDL